MRTLNQQWIDAFSEATRHRGYLVTITTAPGVEHRWSSFDRVVFIGADMVAPGVGTIKAAAGTRLGVIDRRRTIADWEIVFYEDRTAGVASRIRSLASANVLRGKRLTVSIGTTELVEADFELAAANWVIQDVIPGAGFVRVTAMDPGVFAADRKVRKFRVPGHPLKVIRDIYSEVASDELLGDPSFDEKLYTDSSHFVVSRWPYNDRTSLHGFQFPTNEDIVLAEDRAESDLALDQLMQLFEILYGAVDADPSGLLRYINYDPDAAPVKHFSLNEQRDFEQHEIESHVNRVTVTGRSYNGAAIGLYTINDFVAQDLAGFPDTAPVIIPMVLPYSVNGGEPHPWLNTVFRASSASFNSAATTLRILWPKYWGFTGTTEEDASGNAVLNWPVTQQPEHMIDGVDRFAYFLITDHHGQFEYVRATSLALSQETTPIEVSPVPFSAVTFRSFGDYTVERNHWGLTTAFNWSAVDFWVYDVTIAVRLATLLVNRARTGVPECSISVSSRHLDIQLGDPVTLSEPSFLAYQIDGASSNEVFETVAIEPHPFDGAPGFRLRLALMRISGILPGGVETIEFPEDIPVSVTRDFYEDETGTNYEDETGTEYWS